MVLVRALEATRYGEWATILAVIELVAMVGNFGLETVAIRLAAQEPEREGAWVGAATSLRVAIALPVLAGFLAVLAVVASDRTMLLAGAGPLARLPDLGALDPADRLPPPRPQPRHRRLHHPNSVLWAGSVIAIAAAGGGIVAFAIAFIAITLVVTIGLAAIALRTIHVQLARGARALAASCSGSGSRSGSPAP